MEIFSHDFNSGFIGPCVNNQSVNMKLIRLHLDNNYYCRVLPRYTTSTPGIKIMNVKVIPNKKYYLKVVGFSHHSGCTLWAIDYQGNLLINERIYLQKDLCEAGVLIKTKPQTNNIIIGVLYTLRPNELYTNKPMFIKNISLLEYEPHMSNKVIPINQKYINELNTLKDNIQILDNVSSNSSINRNMSDNFKSINFQEKNNGYKEYVIDENENEIKNDIDEKNQINRNENEMKIIEQQKKIIEQQEALLNQTNKITNKETNIKKPLVSFVMTAYNSEKFIKKPIESILNQTYSNIELIIIDDCSNDNTYNICKDLSIEDNRVRVYSNIKNMGTYWSKNFGFLMTRGEFIILHDSDDTSAPTRLEEQIFPLLENRKYLASVCDYERRNSEGKLVLNRGLPHRLALISLLFRKELLDKIGYFDSVRYGADDEFVERIKKFLPKSLHHVPKPLYIASIRNESISNKETVELNKKKNYLSENRKIYSENFTKYHQKLLKENKNCYVPFPLLKRKWAMAHENMNCDKNNSYKDENVTVSICSIPNRVGSLKRTVNSLLPQVDKINIYLNGYDEIPEFLLNRKIHVETSDYFGDLNDNGKFFFDIPYGYHFTCDDDILYPSDYVQKMILKLNNYYNKVVVCCHGMIYPKNMKNFYSKDRKVYSFKLSLDKDKFVNLGGTGTVAYHTKIFNEKYDKTMKFAGMIDVWLSIQCKRKGIPIVSVSRPEKWLEDINENQEMSLYSKYFIINVEKIKDKLCEKCTENFENKKYKLCEDCYPLLENVKDKEHTKYINDEGSWLFEDNFEIYNNISKNLLIENKLNPMKLIDYDYDTTFLKEFLTKEQLKIYRKFIDIENKCINRYVGLIFEFNKNTDNLSYSINKYLSKAPTLLQLTNKINKKSGNIIHKNFENTLINKELTDNDFVEILNKIFTDDDVYNNTGSDNSKDSKGSKESYDSFKHYNLFEGQPNKKRGRKKKHTKIIPIDNLINENTIPSNDEKEKIIK